VAGVSISPQALDQRCAAGAAAFLEDLPAAAVHLVIPADAVAVPLLARFSAVELLGCLTWSCPMS
jgi:hypothetical protein